jgi:prevent-host-death family protein
MQPEQKTHTDPIDALTVEGSARRTFLLGTAGGMATLAAGRVIPAPRAAAAAESTSAAFPAFAYIGCFTSAIRKASAKGISVYRIDQGGDWTLLQTLETVPNPQFIAFDRQQKNLFPQKMTMMTIMTISPRAMSTDSWTVAEAKARLSEVIERAQSGGPQTITKHGRMAVVVVAAEEWERKTKRVGNLSEFLAASPLRGSGMRTKRVKDRPRKVDL